MATVEPLVPTSKSPFGKAASSRAAPTVAIIAALKPAGSWSCADAGVGVLVGGVAPGAGVLAGGVALGAGVLVGGVALGTGVLAGGEVAPGAGVLVAPGVAVREGALLGAGVATRGVAAAVPDPAPGALVAPMFGSGFNVDV
jgi:hypothetical protein